MSSCWKQCWPGQKVRTEINNYDQGVLTVIYFRFIDKYMPELGAWLHYRTVDVSTLKELCKRWYPLVFEKLPKKGLSHRALDDIEESIAELKYYKANMFK